MAFTTQRCDFGFSVLGGSKTDDCKKICFSDGLSDILSVCYFLLVDSSSFQAHVDLSNILHQSIYIILSIILDHSLRFRTAIPHWEDFLLQTHVVITIL